MVKIDKHIKNALHKCLGPDTNISQAMIVKKTGIQQSSISRWISGLTHNMGEHNWFKILPYIEKYLPENYEPKDIHGKKKVFSTDNKKSVQNEISREGHFEALLLQFFKKIKKDKDKLEVIAFAEETAAKRKTHV